MSWTQPICTTCWIEQNPGREPHRLDEKFRVTEHCAWCGQATRSGIYARVNPTTVPYPTSEDGAPL